jgi:hypothetical protein
MDLSEIKLEDEGSANVNKVNKLIVDESHHRAKNYHSYHKRRHNLKIKRFLNEKEWLIIVVSGFLLLYFQTDRLDMTHLTAVSAINSCRCITVICIIVI